MKREVYEIELDKIISISKDFGKEKVILFGSCVEKIESAHDIDIAVKGINPREFFFKNIMLRFPWQWMMKWI